MDIKVSYETYLEENGAMDFEEMNKIYHMIIDQVPQNDAKFDELFKKLTEQAVLYTAHRARWMSMNTQEHLAIDEERSRVHNLFISYKKSLAQYMYDIKLNIAWEDKLGDDRKRIGDFACFLVFIRSINAR